MKESMRLLETLSFTTFIFSLLAGSYICVNAWVHPETLSWQLTHLTPWIREDTFGIISWIVSFASFFVWYFIRIAK